MSVGIDPGFSNDEVFTRRFPVHRACRDGDVGALLSLLQHFSNHAHLTAEDSCHGWTPLHWAAHYGQLECVMRLVQMGCEVNTMTSNFRQTPTHIAAFGGHPHCVAWLAHAGADVNRQDFLGEAPIHKAARSGSLDCIHELLVAGAIPHLRSSCGLTAAELAHNQGLHECVHLLSEGQRDLLRVRSLSGGAFCMSAARKRLLTDAQPGDAKRARTDGINMSVQMQSSDGDESEVTNMEAATQLSSAATINGLHRLSPAQQGGRPSLPNESHSAQDRSPADMCGSLHLAGSPSSCVSYRPTGQWADCDDSLHYGHYHGFGDTAEDLTDLDSHMESSCSDWAERRHSLAGDGNVLLFHSSY